MTDQSAVVDSLASDGNHCLSVRIQMFMPYHFRAGSRFDAS